MVRTGLWDGSQWHDSSLAKVWDGSQWVQLDGKEAWSGDTWYPIGEVSGVEEPVYRPVDWLPVTISPGTQNIQLLTHTLPTDTAHQVQVRISGAFRVDWGDGSAANYASGATATHVYNGALLPAETITSDGYAQAMATITPQAGYGLTAFTLVEQTTADDPVEVAFGPNNIATLGFKRTSTSGDRSLKHVWFLSGHVLYGANTAGSLFAYMRRLFAVTGRIDIGGTYVTQMFYNCSSLNHIPDIGTPNVIHFSGMFQGCSSLPGVPAYNYSKGTNFNSTFQGCSSITSLNGFTLSNVGNADHMFRESGIVHALNVNISGSSPTFIAMFRDCLSLRVVRNVSLTASSGNGNADSLFWFDAALETVDGLNLTGCTILRNLLAQCDELVSVLNLVTPNGKDFSAAFMYDEKLTTITGLNVANATTLYLTFFRCLALTGIPSDLSAPNCTSYAYTFHGCYSLHSIPTLNTASGTDFMSTFAACHGISAIPAIDTSKGTRFGHMFNGCYALSSVPPLDTSNGTTFNFMFGNCQSLLNVPQLVTSKGTDFGYMFYGCSNVTSIPQLDTALGTTFRGMFENCVKLPTVPAINTSRGTDFSYMFNGCQSLTSVPALNTSLGTDFSYMFKAAIILPAVPLFDTSKGTDFKDMFMGCWAMTTIPAFNMSLGTDFTNVFSSCGAATSILAFGIRYNVHVTSTLLAAAALNAFLTNLGAADDSVAPQTVNITGVPGAAGCDRSIATSKGWVVTG